MHILDDALPAACPIVSTVGSEGEGQLRRLRRLAVADVFARFISQLRGQPATLCDVAVAEGADETLRRRFVPGATEALGRLSQDRLVVSGDQLVLISDDLLELVLQAGSEPRWPEAVLSAQRIAIGGSRGALVRFARTDGGGDIEVFTTRPDTIFGASFVAVSPSHPAAQLAGPAQWAAFRAECDKAGDDPNAKVGVPLGLSVHNPFAPERVLPVWLGNFVVETYGTGAAGGCPACDQRDLDFARRYGLPVLSIVCPPGADPATYQVGDLAYAAGDGTIINSGFLSGLPVPDAIAAAVARLVEVGRGVPHVQFRRRPFVVAEEASTGAGDVRHLDRSWRFTERFLTAAALVVPGIATGHPHVLHVTELETATRHLLDVRVLSRAIKGGAEPANQEPWEEIVLVGDVLDPSGGSATGIPAQGSDAFRLAVLADTPPDREVEWSDKRYAVALKFMEGASRLFDLDGGADGIDRATLAGKLAKASAALESALRRRRTNTAVAAVREIVTVTAELAAGTRLDSSAQSFVASLLYSMLPDLAGKGTAAAEPPPAWPDAAAQGDEPGLVELVVQINSKKRGAVQVARDADEEMVIAAVRADGSFRAHLGEKPIRKAIVVPNRLVNLVV